MKAKGRDLLMYVGSRVRSITIRDSNSLESCQRIITSLIQFMSSGPAQTLAHSVLWYVFICSVNEREQSRNDSQYMNEVISKYLIAHFQKN